MSKVHIVYDKDGKIISVGVPLPRTQDFRGPLFGPKASEGQHAAYIEVPLEHSEMSLSEFSSKLKVVSGRLVAR